MAHGIQFKSGKFPSSEVDGKVVNLLRFICLEVLVSAPGYDLFVYDNKKSLYEKISLLNG